ncbi:MAG: CCA tRNA nucleotidyltransferase [Clostridia bacterium]|nr:CCA tRNA nucleotidyltransferase [Clostridia bacterium]
MSQFRFESIKENIPQELITLAELMDSEGFSLCAVGGLVRNSLLDLPIYDIDICSAMEPSRVIELCKAQGFTVVPKGIDFGMVEVHIGEFRFEHTTFRSDTYSDGGAHRPIAISFSKTPEDDAFRRDFSVNALYYLILSGEVLDPTGGLADLEAGLIRTTSKDPRTVLSDDGLRIMRLVRFSAELGFDIEESSMAAAKSLVKNLEDISSERIRDELNKILLSDIKYGERSAEKVFHGLELLKQVGAIGVILPELALGEGIEQKPNYHRYDVLDHCLHSCAEASPTLVLRLAGLLHDVGKPKVKLETGLMHGHDEAGEAIAKAILRRLKYDNKTVGEVCFLVRRHMFDLNNTAKERTLRQNFVRWGRTNSLNMCDIRRADFIGSGIIKGEVASAERWERVLNTMQEQGVPFSQSELNCTGADIMKWLDIDPGPAVAEVKKRLLAHCAVRPKDNTPEGLKRTARGMLPVGQAGNDRQ